MSRTHFDPLDEFVPLGDLVEVEAAVEQRLSLLSREDLDSTREAN